MDSYNAEIRVLEKYMPKQLSTEEIRSRVEEIFAGLNIEKSKKSMGRLMGAVMKELKGLADGNAVKKVVTEFLSEE